MYIQYIQGLFHSKLGTVDYALVTSSLHYKDSLGTWTVVHMTAAKFKPLIFLIIAIIALPNIISEDLSFLLGTDPFIDSLLLQ
jgi:hypothetical protein